MSLEFKTPQVVNIPIGEIIRKIVLFTFLALAIWIVYILFGKNDAGFYQIRQDILSGELSVKRDFGIYFNGIKKVTTYQIESSYTFSNNRDEENVGFLFYE